MKVKRLIQILQALDQDKTVILSGDPEGNFFSELQDVDDSMVFDDEDGAVGYSKLTKELVDRGYSEEDVLKGKPVVILWP